VREKERDVWELDGFHACTLGEDITIQTIVEMRESEGVARERVREKREGECKKKERASVSPPPPCSVRALSLPSSLCFSLSLSLLLSSLFGFLSF